jgi:hypothetical protein
MATLTGELIRSPASDDVSLPAQADAVAIRLSAQA